MGGLGALMGTLRNRRLGRLAIAIALPNGITVRGLGLAETWPLLSH